MRAPLSWINDYVDLSGVKLEDLTNGLNKIGFEVEEVFDYSKGLERVCVAKILKISQHPNADRLSVCQVDAGQHGMLQICTAAKNIAENDFVPLALDGANLPCGIKIEKGMLRGEKSEGMFCGGSEINITEEEYRGAGVDGILILHKGEYKTGMPIADALKRNEIVLEVKFTPNRADAASIVGLAREIAAVLGKKFNPPDLTYKTTKQTNIVDVSVEDYALCPRYMGAMIENVKNGKSPEWMQKRLVLAGHKPYSVLVDITNYVLTEMGQPMHAFDLSKIEGNKIVIRRAKAGERITTLDEKDRMLSEGMLVIADAKKPLVIAGIIGGIESGTFETTKSVFLESAVFSYAGIRKSAKALGVNTSSSARFSRGLCLNSANTGMLRALNLITMLGLGEICAQIKDVNIGVPAKRSVTASVKGINERLALNVASQRMCEILNALDFSAAVKGDVLTAVVPLERTDVERDVDLCEEIGRYYGYENIDENNTTPTSAIFKGGFLNEQINLDRIRNSLAAQGGNEIITFQFISPQAMADVGEDVKKAIEVANPLGREYSLIRMSLLPAMLSTIAYNERQKNSELFLFETGRVFKAKSLPLTELPEEQNHLIISMGADAGDFYDLKNILNSVAVQLGVEFDYRASSLNASLHPGVCADVYAYGKKIGEIGEVHPRVLERFEITTKTYICEINLSAFISREIRLKGVSPISKLPNVERDIALVVKTDVPAGDILKTVYGAAKGIISEARIFDVYTGTQVGEGLKSVAIKMFITQAEKTLTDDELSLIMKSVIAACEKQLGAKLR